MSPAGRRWICRVMFLLFALVPTMLMVVWGAWAHTSRQATQWRQHIEQQILEEFGLTARCQTVARQGASIVLDGLTLHDPETGAEVMTAHQVRLNSVGSANWFIQVAYPRVADGQLLRLFSPLFLRLQSARGPVEATGVLSADHLTLESAQRSISFSQVQCQIASNRSGSLATLNFVIDNKPLTEPFVLRITRDRRSTNPHTIVFLDTKQQFVPVQLFSSWVPALAAAGAECEFSGVVRLRQDAKGWNVEHVSGKFKNLDLYQIVTNNFPQHLITGSANCDVSDVETRDGKLHKCQLKLYSERGIISRSLLQSGVDHLGWVTGPDVEASSVDRWEYRNLRISIRLDGPQVTFQGTSGPSGEALWTEGNWLVRCNSNDLPIANLMCALAPQSEHQVPATRQTMRLASWLPIPAIQRTESPDTAPPSLPLRLKTERSRP
jgi:hypothetical protein